MNTLILQPSWDKIAVMYGFIFKSDIIKLNYSYFFNIVRKSSVKISLNIF